MLGGGGHVGLPLSLAFADAGLRVGVFDINRPTLDAIAAGQMPFLENGAEELLARVLPTGRLELGDSPAMLGRADAVVLVIGTPVDEFLEPVDDACSSAPSTRSRRTSATARWSSCAAPSTRARRSTSRGAWPPAGAAWTSPSARSGSPRGTRSRSSARCPRSSAPTRRRPATGPRRCSGASRRRTIRTSTKEAELAKLFTNTWRYMKFAVANQFFAIADQAGVDYTSVLRAIREDYPRAADLPGPGFAAGPCLFKDTMQLAAFTADHFPMGQAAMQINEGMPAYIVSALERRHGTLRGTTVGILGMAFKAESDDIRASLSFKLRKLLGWAGARVLATDPYVDDDRLVPLEDVLAGSDILVVGAPHRAYRSLDLSGREVVDIWGAAGAGIRL